MHQHPTSANKWRFLNKLKRTGKEKENQGIRDELSLWWPNWKPSQSWKKSRRKTKTHLKVKINQQLKVKINQKLKVKVNQSLKVIVHPHMIVKVHQRTKAHWRANSRNRVKNSPKTSKGQQETSFKMLKMLKWWFTKLKVTTLSLT